MTPNDSPQPIRARLSQPRFGWKNANLSVTSYSTKHHRTYVLRADLPDDIYIAVELRETAVLELANQLVDETEEHA